MVDEEKQVNEITKMLMDVPDAVTYQPNAYKLYADNSYEHKFVVSSNNGELTIDYNKLANAVHKYSYIKTREAAKEFAERYKNQVKNYTEMFTDDGFKMVSLEAMLGAVDFVLIQMIGEGVE